MVFVFVFVFQGMQFLTSKNIKGCGRRWCRVQNYFRKCLVPTLFLSQINYTFSFIFYHRLKFTLSVSFLDPALGEQGEGVYFLFTQEDILNLLLQNYYSGSSQEQCLSFRIPQTQATFYHFTWETLELHLLENVGQICFSELVAV